MTQAIEVEMFPGMSAGGCDFSLYVQSISNIGAAKAMQIIAKTESDKSMGVEATTKQDGTANLQVPIYSGILPMYSSSVIGGGAYFIMNMPKKKSGGVSMPKIGAPSIPGAPAAPAFKPTAPSNQYQVGQIITLANGQKH